MNDQERPTDFNQEIEPADDFLEPSEDPEDDVLDPGDIAAALGQLVRPGGSAYLEYREVARTVARIRGYSQKWADDLAPPYAFHEHLQETTILNCGNSDSMVSSEWGVRIFTLGERGYLYPCSDWSDFGPPDAISIYCWAPADDAAAFEEAFLRFYGAEWDQVGLPPFQGGSVRWWAPVTSRMMVRALAPLLAVAWDDVAEVLLTKLARVLHYRSVEQLAEIVGIDPRSAHSLIDALHAPEFPDTSWIWNLEEEGKQQELEFLACLVLACFYGL